MKDVITIIISIAVPILSSLTYIAYKHPHAYKKLSISSTWFKVGLFYLTAYFIWSMALMTVHEKLVPLIPENKTKEALNILNSINIPTHLFWFVVAFWFILWAYFWLLSGLPFLLKREGNHSNNQ